MNSSVQMTDDDYEEDAFDNNQNRKTASFDSNVEAFRFQLSTS